MALFRRRVDPISSRSRELNAKIASLEFEIRQLNTRIEDAKSGPRLRSTAWPDRAAAPAAHVAMAPVFESVEVNTIAPDGAGTAGHFNELGVRKYDLAGMWTRMKQHFRAPAASNPKLVSYLAAGSVRGLRPLRYEKRVARNRFLTLFVFFLLLLWGIVAVFVRG